MGKNYGIQNEYDFVELLNDKYLYELNEKTQKFIKELFGDVIDNNSKIQAWKNKMYQKTDIFIKYHNYIKSISIKCGNNNSVHAEPIQDFRLFLEKINIPYNVIDKYVSYHYGYKKDENGNTDYTIQLDSEEYKIYYQKELDIFNKYINKTKIIIEMIDRFLVRGKNGEYDIDALICGTIDDYIWILKYDLYDLILSKRCLNYTSPHIACMTIGPKKRCIYSQTYIKERYVVCIRWNNIREDITNYQANKKV